MEDVHGYIEMKDMRQLSAKLPSQMTPELLPEVMVGNNPVELQHVHYSSQGKGSHIAYSCGPTFTVNFDASGFHGPLVNKLHNHEYFEAILVVSGQLTMRIENQQCTFNKWDACILNRNTRHAELFEKDVELFYLVLSPEYLLNWPREEGMSFVHSLQFSQFFNKGLRDVPARNKDYIYSKYTGQAVRSPWRGIVEDIKKEYIDKLPGYQLLVRSLIYRLFSVLANPVFFLTEHTDLGADEGFSLAYSVKQLLDSGKHRVTKQQIGEKLNYSGEYLNHVFKRHYGHTIPEYNKEVCLKHAAFLLASSTMRIHDIVTRLGYTNRTHFYLLFEKKYLCSPGEYRERFKSS